MRHQHKGRSFGRDHDERKALIKSMVRSLIVHERITTTEAKAKELRPIMEKLVTRARTDTVSNRRLVSAKVGDAAAVKKLFTTIAPRFKARSGGYIRIVKRAPSKTTGRTNAYIAFVE